MIIATVLDRTAQISTNIHSQLCHKRYVPSTYLPKLERPGIYTENVAVMFCLCVAFQRPTRESEPVFRTYRSRLVSMLGHGDRDPGGQPQRGAILCSFAIVTTPALESSLLPEGTHQNQSWLQQLRFPPQPWNALPQSSRLKAHLSPCSHPFGYCWRNHVVLCHHRRKKHLPVVRLLLQCACRQRSPRRLVPLALLLLLPEKKGYLG